MELQIQDLVSMIKKEGVDEANAARESILADAKKQAEEIILAANNEAEAVKAKATKEIEAIRESAKVSIEQAKRDAVLSFKDEVKKEFGKILSADVANTLDGDALAKLIIAALGDENPADYTAEVNAVSDVLKAQLAAKVNEGLQIRVSKNIRSGFKLAANDASGYFDCTDTEIAEMMKPFFPDITL